MKKILEVLSKSANGQWSLYKAAVSPSEDSPGSGWHFEPYDRTFMNHNDMLNTRNETVHWNVFHDGEHVGWMDSNQGHDLSKRKITHSPYDPSLSSRTAGGVGVVPKDLKQYADPMNSYDIQPHELKRVSSYLNEAKQAFAEHLNNLNNSNNGVADAHIARGARRRAIGEKL